MAKLHIHQYQRRVLGKNKDYIVYSCATCSHYIPEELVIGKQSLCNRCKKATVIVKKNREGGIPHRPHCDDCTWTRSSKNKSSNEVKPSTMSSFIEQVLGGSKS